MVESANHAEAPANQLGDEVIRLRVHHLFVIMAFAAVGLTAARLIFGGWQFFPVPTYWVGIAAIPLVSAVELGALTVFVGWWRFRKKIRAVEPGEWAAVIPTITCLFVTAAEACLGMPYRSLGDNTINKPLLVVLIVFYAMLSFLVCRLIIRANESWWWKGFYAFLLINALSSLGFMLVSVDTLVRFAELNLEEWSTVALDGVLFITVLIGAITDLARRRKRRWSHWFGILCYGALALFMGGISLLNIFAV